MVTSKENIEKRMGGFLTGRFQQSALGDVELHGFGRAGAVGEAGRVVEVVFVVVAVPCSRRAGCGVVARGFGGVGEFVACWGED